MILFKHWLPIKHSVLSLFKSSQVYFTTSLKVSRQETAIRPCGHQGELHLLAILNSYRRKLKLVIEHKKTQNIINNATGNNNCVASFARNIWKKNTRTQKKQQKN